MNKPIGKACIAMLLLGLPVVVQAQDYNFATNGNTIIITKYIGSGGTVTIPDKLNGLLVTTINDWAFENCNSVRSVAVPHSVTDIKSSAFPYCHSLTMITVDIQNPVYSSTNGILFNKNQTILIECPIRKAGTYTIPNTVSKISNGAFSLCSQLTGITIPDSVTSIGDSAFSFCRNLSSIKILNTLTSVENFTFEGCTSLPSIIIPNSVTNIGKWAFDSCQSLTNVTIGSGVNSIGVRAFSSCPSLTGIAVEPQNAVYSSADGVLFNKNQTTLTECPGGKAGTYAIPNSVTNIADWAFFDCTSLTSITLPNSVRKIGDNVFYCCTNLISVTIPNSVTSMGEMAFAECSRLNKITIADGVTSIGWGAFVRCTCLTSISIPKSVTNIERFAFSDCTNLTSIYFSGDAPSLGSDVFQNDKKATVYHLPGMTGWGLSFWRSNFGGRPTALWSGKSP